MAYVSEYNAFQNIHLPTSSLVCGSLVDNALISGSHEGTLPGNRVFAEVIKLKSKKGTFGHRDRYTRGKDKVKHTKCRRRKVAAALSISQGMPGAVRDRGE